jgi:hypothetical protein
MFLSDGYIPDLENLKSPVSNDAASMAYDE